MRLKAILIVALSLACSLRPADALDLPDIIKDRLATTQKLCTDHGGKAGAAADITVTTIDVDGNGHNDFILDYSKLACDGVPDMYCGGGFCTIDVYTWRSNNAWKLLLVASVADWKIVGTGKKRAFILTQSGSFCGKPKKRTCTVTYTFANGSMHGKMK